MYIQQVNVQDVSKVTAKQGRGYETMEAKFQLCLKAFLYILQRVP